MQQNSDISDCTLDAAGEAVFLHKTPNHNAHLREDERGLSGFLRYEQGGSVGSHVYRFGFFHLPEYQIIWQLVLLQSTVTGWSRFILKNLSVTNLDRYNRRGNMY